MLHEEKNKQSMLEAFEEEQTSKEAQPLGQNVSSFGLNQDLPAVQSHAGPHLPAHIEHGWLLLANTFFRHTLDRKPASSTHRC